MKNTIAMLVSGAAAVLRQPRLKHLLPLALVAIPLMVASAEAARREPGQPKGCPSKWCGCYLAHYYGISHRKDLWRARNWARVGRATRPRVGAIVVWRNHVGVIVGKTAKGWVVKSGNDGNRVRTRIRTIHNAIAFRALK